MNIEEVRNICLSLPHVTERCPFGPDCLVFEIGGRMFCLLDLSGKWNFYNIKVDPFYSEQLREKYSSVFPGFHMNKRHWVSVRYNADFSDEFHRSLLQHAYNQTISCLTKKMRIQLFGSC